MKRFHFPLERVREWRKTQVDVEYAKLGKLFDEMRRLESVAARLVEEVHGAEQEIEQAIGGGVAIDSVQLVGLDDFRLYVKREEKLLGAQQEDLRGQIAKQRNRLIDARRNFRLLEKLKEKARGDWDRAFSRELEDLASELHLANWNRQKSAAQREPNKLTAS